MHCLFKRHVCASLSIQAKLTGHNERWPARPSVNFFLGAARVPLYRGIARAKPRRCLTARRSSWRRATNPRLRALISKTAQNVIGGWSVFGPTFGPSHGFLRDNVRLAFGFNTFSRSRPSRPTSLLQVLTLTHLQFGAGLPASAQG